MSVYLCSLLMQKPPLTNFSPPVSSKSPCWRFCGSVLLLVVFSGCAGVSYRALTAEDDVRADGFRYYDPSPYLLVQTDGNGGLKSDLKWLPDLTKLRHAKPYQFLAKNDVTFDFTNGVLTQGNTEGDGTEVPKAFISALETVASSAIKAGAFLKGPGGKKVHASDTLPRVYLFKIVQNGNKSASPFL